MATLTLQQIRKTYPNGYRAIHGIDLTVTDGEFIVIVGPSGCGKSSLLRMIAGLETISEGEMKIDDRLINGLEPAQRDIAMVFQNYALYPHMTVYANMAYGLRNRGAPKAQIEEDVQRTAKILELEPLLARKPAQLSGGQRQRVAMGRAIVRDPKIFLFDEPLSNLDAKLRVQMRLEIKKLQRQLGTTAVYVTHDQVEAMTLADRLVVMNGGVVEQIGTPMEIYERPATPFVAGFIGSPAMNFMPGQLHGRQLQMGERMIDMGLTTDYRGSVLVGVRPEHLHREAGAPHRLDMHLSMIEPLGADTLVYGELTEGRENLVARINGHFKAGSENSMRLHFSERDLHIYCEQSGQRLN